MDLESKLGLEKDWNKVVEKLDSQDKLEIWKQILEGYSMWVPSPSDDIVQNEVDTESETDMPGLLMTQGPVAECNGVWKPLQDAVIEPLRFHKYGFCYTMTEEMNCIIAYENPLDNNTITQLPMMEDSERLVDQLANLLGLTSEEIRLAALRRCHSTDFLMFG